MLSIPWQLCICGPAISNVFNAEIPPPLPTGVETCLVLLPLWHLFKPSPAAQAAPFPGLAGVSHPAGLITAEYFFQDWVVTNFPVLLTTSPSQNNWLNPPPISPLSEADTPTANGWDVLKVTRIPPSKTLEPSGDWKYSTLPLRQPSPRLTHFLVPAEVKRDWGDLMAPLIGRDGAVGFHSGCYTGLHEEKSEEKRIEIILHALLCTRCCCQWGLLHAPHRASGTGSSVPCGISRGPAKECLAADTLRFCSLLQSCCTSRAASAKVYDLKDVSLQWSEVWKKTVTLKKEMPTYQCRRKTEFLGRQSIFSKLAVKTFWSYTAWKGPTSDKVGEAWNNPHFMEKARK